MSAKSNAPIIIKRKKVVAGGGHHGGAWKVAYADFVTAMMAFFMLMWLLNATTEKQRKGIADYFSPTIPINRISGGGDGAFGGDSVFSDDTLAQNGTGAMLQSPSDQAEARGASSDSGSSNAAANLEEIEHALTAFTGESMVSPEAQRHIVTRVTDEGLIVELFDLEGAPLFKALDGAPTPIMEELVAMISRVFRLVGNDIAVNGHTRAQPIVLADNPTWVVSAGRADRVRLMLGDEGLNPDRVHRVAGFADRKLSVRNPMDPRNNRIELILLRSQR